MQMAHVSSQSILFSLDYLHFNYVYGCYDFLVLISIKDTCICYQNTTQLQRGLQSPMQHPMLKELHEHVEPHPHMSTPMSRGGEKPLCNNSEKHLPILHFLPIQSILTFFFFNSIRSYIYILCLPFVD